MKAQQPNNVIRFEPKNNRTPQPAPQVKSKRRVKATLTYMQRFNKKAIPVTAGGAMAVIMLYSFGQYLIGTGLAVSLLVALYFIRRHFQLHTIVSDKGIEFKLNKMHAKYTWEEVQEVRAFPQGIQFSLPRMPGPMAVASQSTNYADLVKRVREGCEQHGIQCTI